MARRKRTTRRRPARQAVARQTRAASRRLFGAWQRSRPRAFLARRWALCAAAVATCTGLAVLVSACQPQATRERQIRQTGHYSLADANGPGTSYEVLDSQRLIRVLLVDRDPSLPVSVAGPYTVLDAARRVLYRSPAPLAGPIRSINGEIVLDGRSFAGQPNVWILPQRDGSLVVNDVAYRGVLNVVRAPATAELSAINVLDIELYLLGLDEMPAKFSYEAHKAQAIAARTYALFYKFASGRNRPWDVLATEGSQVYEGIPAEEPVRVQATRATAGIVATWMSPTGEKLFPTYFSSNCGGVTQDVGFVKPTREADPLRGGVQSPLSATMPNATWPTWTISDTELTRRLSARYPKIAALGTITQVNVLARTPEGRMAVLEVVDDAGRTEKLRGEDFRLCMDTRKMKSTWCTISKQGRNFVFTNGKGFGHGMGMCQWGAEALARQGQSAEDILYLYYPGSRLAKAYEYVPGQEPRISPEE